MGRHRPEVFDTLGQRILEIRHPDLPDHWKGLARFRADRHVQVAHGYASVNVASSEQRSFGGEAGRHAGRRRHNSTRDTAGSQRRSHNKSTHGQKLGGPTSASGPVASRSVHSPSALQQQQVRSAWENANPNWGTTLYPTSMPRSSIILSIFVAGAY